jgi:hypothetical protein
MLMRNAVRHIVQVVLTGTLLIAPLHAEAEDLVEGHDSPAQGEVVPRPAPAGPVNPEDPVRYQSIPRWELIIPGTIAFAMLYGYTCSGPGREMCIPVAGPFVFMARRIREDSGTTPSSESEGPMIPPAFAYLATAGIGLLEAAAVGVTIVGIAVPRRIPVRQGSRVQVIPLVAPDNAGISIRAAF